MNISNEGRERDKKMEKLEKCDYGNAAGLFEGTNHGIPLIYSVLEGKGTGNIYVDSVSEPKNALILPQGGFFYLASKDHSRNFLLQVKELIFQELMPAWSCWPFRTESAALARKLGFEEKGAADAHFWAENM